MTVMVKTLKAHGNASGATFRKKEGDVYPASDADARRLAAIGLVEIADDSAVADLDKMTKADLTALAVDAGVDIGAKDTKAEIVAKLRALDAGE